MSGAVARGTNGGDNGGMAQLAQRAGEGQLQPSKAKQREMGHGALAALLVGQGEKCGPLCT